jgi:uncharacterized membrane protein YhiD involved in acid resistance
MNESAGLAGIFVAALGGAAIGVERQRSGHASGPATPAVRTHDSAASARSR